MTSTRQRVFKSTDDDANDKFYLEAKGLHDDWLKAFENPPPLSLHAPLLSDRESAKPQKKHNISTSASRAWYRFNESTALYIHFSTTSAVF